VKAVVFDRPGDEAVLRIADAPDPIVGAGELGIRVAATAVNRADLLQRQGRYPPPPGASEILGLECAGVVETVGDGVTSWRTGDRAMALLAGGGYAEKVAVAAGCVLPVPASLTLAEAAALPEVFLTVFLTVFRLAGLRRGEVVLVHGGSGGVGTAAIALVKEAGARALVTAGSDERCARCLALGADAAVNYRSQDFVAAAREATAGKGVDIVLDCVGAPYLERNLDALAVNGRLVLIALIGGGAGSIDLRRVLTRRLSVIGSTLRARPVAEKAATVSAFQERFGEAVAAGRLRPVIDRVLPLEEAAQAHRLMAAGGHFGKLVLQIS
jgi:putative PIG3 family NAD(P)H quinone oxidoreductase